MIKLTDLKVGDYLRSFYNTYVFVVKKINKKSFTTTKDLTIHEKEFEHYFVITREEARASVIHDLNKELRNLNKNLNELKENLGTTPLRNSWYTVDVQTIEDIINDLLESIREELQNE